MAEDWCPECAGIGRVRVDGLSVICSECWTVNALCEWCNHAAREHNHDDLYCQAEGGCGCDIYRRRNEPLEVPR